MKFLFILTALLSIHTAALAGTHACEKLAYDKALDDVQDQVADDCFVRFVQASKDTADLINVGISCDHTDSYIYQILTAPTETGCSIVKLQSRPTERNL